MKCQKCLQPLSRRFAPTLIQSGFGVESGRDMRCPVCNTLYSSQTGREYKNLMRDKSVLMKKYWKEGD